VTAGSCSEDSTTATVHICHAPVITSPPVSETLPLPAEGQTITATASVGATGDNLLYAWTLSTAPNNVISRSPSLTVSFGHGNGTAQSYTYNVTITNANAGLPGGCTDTVSASVTFTLATCDLSLYTIPGNVTVFQGANTFPLTVGAWGTGTFRFEWYHGMNGTAIPFGNGGTVDTRQGVTFSTVTGALNSQYDAYWCVISLAMDPAHPETVTCSLTTPKSYVSYFQSCPLPPATISPSNSTVTPGTQTTLTAYCDWPSVTYQWYRGPSGDDRDPISGATQSSLSVGSIPASYWCRVTNECGTAHEDTTTAMISSIVNGVTCSPPTIVQQPQSVDIAAGGNATLRVDANNSTSTLSYTWWIEGAASPIPNATAPQLTVQPAVSTTFHAEIYNTCSGTITRTLPATVHIRSCPSITITAQPASGVVPAGSSLQLRIVASSSDTISYQWFRGTDAAATAITGATQSTYLATPDVTTTYWVRLTTSSCTIDSAPAVIEYCTAPTITGQPRGTDLTVGQMYLISAAARGTNIRYEWHQGTPESPGPVLATSGAFWLRALDTTTYFVRVIGDCGSVDSDTATINVCATPTINTQPASQTVYYNTSETLTVGASDATTTPISYQWYAGASGDASQPIAGATSATYTTPLLSTVTTYQYWVAVSD